MCFKLMKIKKRLEFSSETPAKLCYIYGVLLKVLYLFIFTQSQIKNLRKKIPWLKLPTFFKKNNNNILGVKIKLILICMAPMLRMY